MQTLFNIFICVIAGLSGGISGAVTAGVWKLLHEALPTWGVLTLIGFLCVWLWSTFLLMPLDRMDRTPPIQNFAVPTSLSLVGTMVGGLLGFALGFALASVLVLISDFRFHKCAEIRAQGPAAASATTRHGITLFLVGVMFAFGLYAALGVGWSGPGSGSFAAIMSFPTAGAIVGLSAFGVAMGVFLAISENLIIRH